MKSHTPDKTRILWLLVLVVVACTPSKNATLDIGDGGLLTDGVCKAPCFWGIRPAITTEQEVAEVLKAKAVSEECETYNTEPESGPRGISCRHTLTISFRRGTNIVEDIAIRPTQTITIQEVITKYGRPDAVQVTSVGLPERRPPQLVMIIYFDSIKTRLHLPEQVGATYMVNPSTELVNIGYFDDSMYETLRQGAALRWRGYGNYPKDSHEPNGRYRNLDCPASRNP